MASTQETAIDKDEEGEKFWGRGSAILIGAAKGVSASGSPPAIGAGVDRTPWSPSKGGIDFKEIAGRDIRLEA
jgi:hypothetical protein